MASKNEGSINGNEDNNVLTIVKLVSQRGVVARSRDRFKPLLSEHGRELQSLVVGSFSAHPDSASMHVMQTFSYYGVFIIFCSNLRTMQAIDDINRLPAEVRTIDGIEIEFVKYTRNDFDGVFAIISSENTQGEVLRAVQNLTAMSPEVHPETWRLIAKVKEGRDTRYIIGTDNVEEKANIARAMWRNEPRWIQGIHQYRTQCANRRWEIFLMREWGKFIDEVCAELNLIYSEEGTGILKRENEPQYFGPSARKNADSLLMVAPRRRR